MNGDDTQPIRVSESPTVVDHPVRTAPRRPAPRRADHRGWTAITVLAVLTVALWGQILHVWDAVLMWTLLGVWIVTVYGGAVFDAVHPTGG